MYIGSIYRININRNSYLSQIEKFKVNIKLGVTVELDPSNLPCHFKMGNYLADTSPTFIFTQVEEVRLLINFLIVLFGDFL